MNLHVSAKGLAVLSALLSFAAPAMAADATLGVSAEVTKNCTVSTTPVDFGQVDATAGIAVDGTGALKVTCTSGTPWTVSADAGTGEGATLTDRHMSNGPHQMSYTLYTDSARSQIWGDDEDSQTTTFGDNGTGVEQTKTIYAKVAPGQTGLPSGNYSDTVNLTITY